MVNYQFADLVDNLFNDFQLINKPGEKIIKGNIHPLIMQEIYKFVDVVNQYKNHPLGFLRHHVNAGKNSFQVSVPTPIFENSLTLPYLTHLGERAYSEFTKKDIKQLRRKISVNKHHTHFDGYDFWFNFSLIGSSNPLHTHSGDISSVIYICNTETEPTVFEDNFKYYGKPGEIILFNAKYPHCVDEKMTDNERVTASCNILFKESEYDR